MDEAAWDKTGRHVIPESIAWESTRMRTSLSNASQQRTFPRVPVRSRVPRESEAVHLSPADETRHLTRTKDGLRATFLHWDQG